MLLEQKAIEQDPSWSPSYTPPHEQTRPTLAKGTILSDRYQIIRGIGSGGLAAVYLCNDLKLDERYALKLIRSTVSEAILERFRQEYRVLEKLSHPGIVRVFQYEEDTRSKCLYYTMEYIAGLSLQEHIEEKRKANITPPYTAQEALIWLEKIVEPLTYMHDRGILHRDLKPSNIMVDLKGQLHILDFGVARLRDNQGPPTEYSERMGTSYYMAPERITEPNSHPEATDVFSVAVILYYMLTGTVPMGMASAPSELFPNIPSALDQVLQQAMHPIWRQRTSNLGTLLRQFQEALTPTQTADYRAYSSPYTEKHTQLPTSQPSLPQHRQEGPMKFKETPHRANPSLSGRQGQRATPIEVTEIGPKRRLPQRRTKQETPHRSTQPMPTLGNKLPTHTTRDLPAFERPVPQVRDAAKDTQSLPTIRKRDLKPMPHKPKREYLSDAPGTRRTTRDLPTLNRVQTSDISAFQANTTQDVPALKVNPGRQGSRHTPSSLPALEQAPHQLSTKGMKATSLAFSKDGNFLAMGTQDGYIHIWEASSWYDLHTMKVSQQAIHHLCWSPLENNLAYQEGDGPIHVFNPMYPQTEHRLPVQQLGKALLWHPYENKLLFTNGTRLRLWNLSSSLPPLVLQGHDAIVEQLFYGPMLPHSSTTSVISIDQIGAGIQWDIAASACHKTFQLHKEPTAPIVAHATQPTLYFGNSSGTITEWSLEQQIPTHRWQAHEGKISTLLAIKHGNYLLSSDGANQLQVWSTKTHQVQTGYHSPTSRLELVTLSPQHQWAAVYATSGHVLVWNLTQLP